MKNNRYKISLIKLPLYKFLDKYIAFKIFTESLLCLITFLTSLLLIYGVEVNIFVKSFSLPWYNNHFWTILIDTVLKTKFHFEGYVWLYKLTAVKRLDTYE